jgi:hypothetical protein
MYILTFPVGVVLATGLALVTVGIMGREDTAALVFAAVILNGIVLVVVNRGLWATRDQKLSERRSTSD